MNRPIIIVGAGIGGLAAAALLAKSGKQVLVLEARPGPGGLASATRANGRTFDSGPYILLDRPGLSWAFHQLGEELARHVDLRAIERVYQVELEDGPTVEIFANLDRTADGFDKTWPGMGNVYRRFVGDMTTRYKALQPLQYDSHPSSLSLLKRGRWRQIPFLLGSLQSTLNRYGFPPDLIRALGIWTHVAGQSLEDAPPPLAFVPALIHTHGAFYPIGGMETIALALEKIARDAGTQFRYGHRVERILETNGRSSAVEVGGERFDAELVISNASAISTYLNLLPSVRAPMKRKLEALPLQSPGVCTYLSATASGNPPYLKFHLPRTGLCRLLIQPAAVDTLQAGTARLLGPVDHAWASVAGREGQEAYLEKIIQEPWWKAGLSAIRIEARRTPADWGRDFHLYRDSMNPVMTKQFMREGRMAHRSAESGGLFLAGSSTHPGQWVSFCAISGILAAREALC